MNKKTKAALMISACGGFLFNVSPVYANEVNYQLTYNDEQSLVSVLKKEFSQNLGDLKIIEKQGEQIILESKEYRVVLSLDFESEDVQKMEASLYEKSVNELLEELGFPQYSIETIDCNVEIKDTEAPVIEVSESISTSLNEEVDWDQIVQVTDDKDGSINYSIDGNIDYSKEGTYEVTILAEDESGNSNSKVVTVEVKDDEFYQKIADAALAQIGVNQDCTMLVTNSLAAVGISFHGSPYEYASLGEWTDSPVPGDICIYDGHVAIYIGNGQAVHGGWLGYTTVVSSVECTNSFIGYIHVNH